MEFKFNLTLQNELLVRWDLHLLINYWKVLSLINIKSLTYKNLKIYKRNKS